MIGATYAALQISAVVPEMHGIYRTILTKFGGTLIQSQVRNAEQVGPAPTAPDMALEAIVTEGLGGNGSPATFQDFPQGHFPQVNDSR